ncbi:MAG: hypothetical protein JNM99_07585 [Verrucomicrobiaceae bacterium]|nr:hypothetical protein [Verrucomicrobiaceae bacterium]
MVNSADAQVPAPMQRDFTTARNHIPMKWNPQGYWASPPGAFKSGGSASEVSAMFTQTEQARGRIPKGYSFSVNSQGQFVVSGGAIPKSTPPPPAAPAVAPVPAPAPAPVKPVEAKPVPKPEPKVTPQPVAKPVPTPPPASKPVTKPQPAPKPQPKVQSAPPPAPPAPPVKKAAPVIETPPPALKPNPAAMRAAVLDPIRATPATAKPSAPVADPQPAAASVNGIPGDMAKSFLSRHKPVFMLFDKDSGSWKSSEGALKDLSTADEWCKQATAIDRRWKRIPENYSYKHVGAGQVQVSKD